MAAPRITNIEFESGYIVLTDESSNKTRHPIADILRAADIPAITYSQVAQITTLANLVAVLVRTLIDREVLDESFLEEGDFNLDDIVETIEGMGGDYGEPDLTY